MRIYRKGTFSDFKYAKGKVDLYGKTFHSYYEIYLFLQGEAEYICPDMRLPLSPYQLIVIPSGEYHQISVKTNADAYERCVINVEPDSTEADILKETALSKRIFLLHKEDRIIRNFEYLRECAERLDDSDFSRVLSAVTTDITVLLKHCNDTLESATENLSETAKKTMRYVNEHFTEDFDLESLAEKNYCSVSLMCHEFKSNFNISIKKYVEQKRMTLANLELKKGERPELVSERCGFSNYSSFFRAYKKHFGISPSKTVKKAESIKS